MVTSTVAGAELTRTVVWSTQVGEGLGSPTPYPDADRPDSVVVAAGREVMRLDGKTGAVIFRYDLGDDIHAMSAVADIDGDGAAEIVAGTMRGHIVALDGQGRPKWHYETRHPFFNYANVVLAERPAGGREVLIQARDGWLTCLDGRGRHRWTFRIADSGHISAPAVADLTGDGVPEYVAGIDAERIVAITAEGELLWEFAVPGESFGREVAVIADADRDGRPEVYILKEGATSALYSLDGASGQERWVVPIPAKCYCAVTVADITGNGEDEILVGTKYNQIFAFNHRGEMLWMQTMGGHGIFHSPAVGDVTGDGRLEIVTGVRHASIEGHSLWVLDAEGNILGGYPQERDGNAAVMIGDITGDGLLEVVHSGRNTVFAYRFGGPNSAGRVLWPCYRGNAALTGSQLGLRPARIAPADRGGDEIPALQMGRLLPAAFDTILGDTPVTATWSAPSPAQGYGEVSVVNPRGMRLTQYFRISPGAQSAELSLPFHHAGEYAVTARLLDTASGRREVVAETRRVTYEPLATERAMVREALEASAPALAAMAGAAPQIAAGLERRRATLQAGLTALEGRVAAAAPDEDLPQIVLDEAAALRARTAREKAFAAFAANTAAALPDSLFAVWHDANPWDYRDPRDELPPAAAEKVSFAAWAYGAQREDFCFNLVTLGADPHDVRVEPADLVGPGDAKAAWEDHLTLLQVVWMPTTLSPDHVPDMLPAMNAGRTVQLAPGHFAQVWMVVDTAGLAPGRWTIPVRFQSLTMSAAACEATLELEVLPVELPYPYPWKMCNWAWPMRFPQPLRDRVIENLIAHGSNVFYAQAPSRACDPEGNLVGEADWTALDQLVAKAKPGDPFLFFTGLPLSAPAGMSGESPEYKRAFKAWMQEFVAHLEAIGITRRDFVWYPVDEPGNSGYTGIEQLIAAAKVLREADPQAPIYANPAGAAYTLEWVQDLDPWVDVWQPAFNLSPRRDFHEVMSARGRRVWMYDAPGDVRMLSTLSFYRRQPWEALRNQASGSGFWVYYYSDLWAVGPRNEPPYGTVYIDRSEVVNSRRWRATHHGVQDVTAVLLLDDAVAAAEQAGVDRALCEKARAVRAAALAEIAPDLDDLPPLDWEALQRHRRAIADALVELRAATAAQ